MRLRLSVRLFLSHAAVAVLGAAVVYLTVRLLAPRLYDQHMSMMGGMGSGMGGMGMGPAGARNRAALVSAVDTAMALGLLASSGAAGVLAIVLTRRLLRPLTAVRNATGQIAAGNYTAAVPLPAEPELAALAADVNTLAEHLADTETRRTRLLGEVAHEMRTPLTALDGMVEGLIDGVFDADADTLAALSSELRRLHRLADDLSRLSRTEEQRFDLHPVDADLAEITRRSAARLAPQFDDAGLVLVVDAERPVAARVDADRITQVLTNLLGNALLATPAGGTVTVTARAGRDHAELIVTDTGVGLDVGDTERIFERFYRAPGQPRRSAGSGIGLTIARGIARASGGEVTAASPGAGHGATFTVTLPLAGAPREG